LEIIQLNIGPISFSYLKILAFTHTLKWQIKVYICEYPMLTRRDHGDNKKLLRLPLGSLIYLFIGTFKPIESYGDRPLLLSRESYGDRPLLLSLSRSRRMEL